MSSGWEQYRDRYAANRPETFDAYLTVWNASAAARSRFSSWAAFSQCANAEPARRNAEPKRVAAAEAIMRDHSFEIGPNTRRGARTWHATKRV